MSAMCGMATVESSGQSSTVPNCEECRDNVDKPSEGFCEDCRLCLCQACIVSHKSSRRFDRHVILAMAALDLRSEGRAKLRLEKREPMCDKHDGKRMEVFCPTHKTAACLDCTILEHKGCPYTKLQEACDQHIRGIRSGMQSLQERMIGPLQRDIRNIQKQQIDSAAEADEAVAHIKADFAEMRSVLEKRHDTLLCQVEMQRTEDKERLQGYADAMKADLHSAQQVNSTAEDLILNFNRTTIISRAVAMQRGLHQVRRTKDIVACGPRMLWLLFGTMTTPYRYNAAKYYKKLPSGQPGSKQPEAVHSKAEGVKFVQLPKL